MNEDIPLSPLYQNAKNGSSSGNVFNVTQTTSFKPGATFNVYECENDLANTPENVELL